MPIGYYSCLLLQAPVSEQLVLRAEQILRRTGRFAWLYGPPEERISWRQHDDDYADLAEFINRPILMELLRRENMICEARCEQRTAQIRAMLAKIAEENVTCSVVDLGENKSCMSLLRNTYELYDRFNFSNSVWHYMLTMSTDRHSVDVEELQQFDAVHASNCPFTAFFTQSSKLNLTREMIFPPNVAPVSKHVLQRAEQLLRKTFNFSWVYGPPVQLIRSKEAKELRQIYNRPIYNELMLRANLLCPSRRKQRNAAIREMIRKVEEADFLCFVQNPSTGHCMSCILALRLLYRLPTAVTLEQSKTFRCAMLYMYSMINHPESV